MYPIPPDVRGAAAEEVAPAVRSVITLPDTCPGCGVAWEGQATCARCGLSRDDVAALLRQGCAAYERARTAAAAGRYAEAETHLATLRRCATPDLAQHPAVRRLTELCALVHSGGSDAARADYQAARLAAAAGDWPAAAAASARAAEAAPALLPVRKLHLLCLFATGHTAAAERLRRAITAVVPGDPDLARWRFAKESGEVAHRVRPTRRAARSMLPMPPRREAGPDATRARPASRERIRKGGSFSPSYWIGGLAVGAALLSFAALTVAVMTALRPIDPMPRAAVEAPQPRVSPTPFPRAIPGPPDRGTAPPAGEPRGLESVRQEAAERQARVWFNAAVQARREGRLSDAMALAAEAYQAGPSTYLADEALLIRAQCADNLNDRTAAHAYVRLASEKPGSVYAPLALLQAAKVARRQGRPEDAVRYLTWLRERYPWSRQAAQQKREFSDFSVAGESSSATKDHGKRQ